MFFKEKKRKLIVLLTILIVFSCFSCSSNQNEIITPPYERYSEEKGIFSFQFPYYDFTSLISEADAIAHIKIGNWIGENGENGVGWTYFDAEVLTVLKGDLPQTITFMQNGYSEGYLRNHPLCTYGNELLVFLYEREQDNKIYYHSIYAEETMFDILSDEKGKKYVIDYLGISMFEEILTEVSVPKNVYLTGKELIKIKKGTDPFWENYEIEPKVIIELDSLISLIAKNLNY